MKKWYLSKTLWVNFIAIIAIIIFGVQEVPPETMAVILGAINMILRLITKEPVIWSEKK